MLRPGRDGGTQQVKTWWTRVELWLAISLDGGRSLPRKGTPRYAGGWRPSGPAWARSRREHDGYGLARATVSLSRGKHL